MEKKVKVEIPDAVYEKIVRSLIKSVQNKQKPLPALQKLSNSQ